MTSKHVELWNRVSQTPKDAQKDVKLGRTFTAIDPYYQIMRATEEFGVAGEGWGCEVVETKFLPTDQVAVLVKLWHGKRENYIEQWGQNGFYIDGAKKRPDGDCMKKATTDGLTKCLSYLGFSADIFLKKFCDNKYISGQLSKGEEEVEVIFNKLKKWLAPIDTLERLKTMEASDLTAAEKAKLKELSESKFDEITALIKKKEDSFGEN